MIRELAGNISFEKPQYMKSDMNSRLDPDPGRPNSNQYKEKLRTVGLEASPGA
jgi:hypothetical protein